MTSTEIQNASDRALIVRLGELLDVHTNRAIAERAVIDADLQRRRVSN